MKLGMFATYVFSCRTAHIIKRRQCMLPLPTFPHAEITAYRLFASKVTLALRMTSSTDDAYCHCRRSVMHDCRVRNDPLQQHGALSMTSSNNNTCCHCPLCPHAETAALNPNTSKATPALQMMSSSEHACSHFPPFSHPEMAARQPSSAQNGSAAMRVRLPQR